MGGVDSLDNFVSAYRISVKAKKWWWPYFVNYIDISLTNAWRIHRLIHGNKVSQLDFRRRVALALLSCEDSDEPSETHGGGGGRENPLTGYPDSKLLNSGHIVVHNDDMRRIRCRWCKSNTVYGCSKCRVSLHPKCFAAFHSAKTK
jgi:DNA excision repair protein ERCC-6